MHNQKHIRNYNQVFEQTIFHKEIDFVLWKRGVYYSDNKMFERHLANIEEECEHDLIKLS